MCSVTLGQNKHTNNAQLRYQLLLKQNRISKALIWELGEVIRHSLCCGAGQQVGAVQFGCMPQSGGLWNHLSMQCCRNPSAC